MTVFELICVIILNIAFMVFMISIIFELKEIITRIAGILVLLAAAVIIIELVTRVFIGI